VVILNVPQ